MTILDNLGLKQIFSKNARHKRCIDFRQSMADRCKEAVAVMSIDGQLQLVNDAWASLHDYSNKDDLVGRNIRQFYSGKALDNFFRFIAQTKLLGWYIASIEQSRRDGTSFPAQLKMAVLKDDSAKPNAILLIVSDLSHISRMKKIIQQNNNELENLKARISRLESALAKRNQQVAAVRETVTEQNPGQPGLSVPITEMKQLAEMAKRLK